MQNKIRRKLGIEPLKTSLTSFTDFVLESGISKLTIARKILDYHCSDYSRGRDYYRLFREKVTDTHTRRLPVSGLRDLLANLPTKSHAVNYEHLVRGYQRFWARYFQERLTNWVVPARTPWQTAHLTVRVNPELGFEADGQTHYIKLYMKSDAPSSRQLAVILHLMQVTLWSKSTRPIVGVLDVRRGQLFEATSYDRRFEPLLRGEAVSLVTMCRMLEIDQVQEGIDSESSTS